MSALMWKAAVPRPVAGALLAVDGPPGVGRARQAELLGVVPGDRQRVVAPAERVGGGVRLGVGQHREHERLGVPERVPVVAGPGQALGRDGPVLGPGARLQDVEEAEPDRLLDLDVAVHLDVGALPEVVEVGPLLVEQPLPAGQLGCRDGAADLVDEGGPGPLGGPAVAHVLDDAELFARRDLGRDHQAAEVGERLGLDRHPLGAVDVVNHRGGEPELARAGGVHEEGPRLVAVHGHVILADQGLGQGRGGAGVAGGGRDVLVGDQLRHQHQAERLVDRRDRVGERGDRALGQRDEPDGVDLDGVPGGRRPGDVPGQGAGPQVEGAGVLADGAVPDIERLVVDQQPDDLAVGDVDDGLPGVGEPVPGLRVGQRPVLVDRVQVGAGEPVGLALVEVAAQADVTVGEREDRLALRDHVQVEGVLGEGPGFSAVRLVRDHLSVFPSMPSGYRRSARSLTTTSAPCWRSASACPTRSTPTTSPNLPAWPAATPARASS